VLEALAGLDTATAWLAAARHLANQPRYECYDLAVTIEDPLAEEVTVSEAYRDLLAQLDLPSIETVANTIFPDLLWQVAGSRSLLYERYLRMMPRLRRFPKNRNGTYFGRLVSWPESPLYNQVEEVIERIRRELSNRSRKRFVYDLLVFQPSRDAYPYGFPCLSYLNVKLDTSSPSAKLLMTAHYRNHYFIERAYGNYVGLGRLQRFISDGAGVERGPLTCVSGHAELDHDKVNRDVVSLIRSLS
jgi:hypothetical protein